jgi:hypothetical protein
MEIKKGSIFTLYDDKSQNPIENLVFKENKTYYGDRMGYLPDGNKQVYFIEGIDSVFPKSGIRFDDLVITIENGDVTWVKNNSSSANFGFEDIDYYTVNDSICHFKCSGERRKHCFLYSMYDTTIQIKADIKLVSVNR